MELHLREVRRALVDDSDELQAVVDRCFAGEFTGPEAVEYAALALLAADALVGISVPAVAQAQRFERLLGRGSLLSISY